jgi:hypothetical protein
MTKCRKRLNDSRWSPGAGNAIILKTGSIRQYDDPGMGFVLAFTLNLRACSFHKPTTSLVNINRYVLPIILFIVFLTKPEHLAEVISAGTRISAEVFFFGILGPTAVFIVLSKMLSFDAQITTSRQLML